MEADAVEIAQPSPLNAMSSITPSRKVMDTSTWSPQRGLWPCAVRLQSAGRRPKFRGLRLWSRITSS